MMARSKQYAGRWITGVGGGALLGRWDHFRHPELKASWGGPFNGQQGRERIFVDIITAVPVAAIVETGTYRGTTTERFAVTGLPVFTIEGSPRNFGFARARLRSWPNVCVKLGDSRRQLTQLLQRELGTRKDQTIFFYLDAHWNADLPLAEELEIIFQNCSRAIVMIDDFAVPDDAHYTYDDYGPGKALNAAYVAPAVERFELLASYPALPGDEESGMKRGSVVLANEKSYGEVLSKLSSLRPASRPPNA